MANPSQIENLAERKRLLLSRCEQHRQQMSADMNNLHSTAVWVERGFVTMKRIRTVWPLIATAVGFLIARKRRAQVKTGNLLLRKARKIFAWWRVGKKLTGLLRSYSMAGHDD